METTNNAELLLKKMQQDEDPEKFADALGLLERLVTKYRKILLSLLTNPDEDKFKHIKTTVKTLATRLFNIRLMPDLLISIGFTQVYKLHHLKIVRLGIFIIG